MQNLFVYGTLLSSEIIEKLTGKTFETTHAVLEGYKIYCVKDCDYPAIIQQEGSKTVGLLFENMDDFSLAIISFYEGGEYKQRQVKVLCNNKYEAALTFVWSKELRLLENKDWDFEDFQKNRLKFYLDDIVPETYARLTRNEQP